MWSRFKEGRFSNPCKETISFSAAYNSSKHGRFFIPSKLASLFLRSSSILSFECPVNFTAVAMRLEDRLSENKLER